MTDLEGVAGVTCMCFGSELRKGAAEKNKYYLAVGSDSGHVLVYLVYRTENELQHPSLGLGDFPEGGMPPDEKPELIMQTSSTNNFGHEKTITSLFFLNDHTLVSASEDHKVIVWNVAEGTQVNSFSDSAPVTAAIAIDGTDCLVTANMKNVVQLMSVSSEISPQRIKFDKEIRSLCLDAEKTSVLVGSTIGILLIVRLQPGKKKMKFQFQNRFSQRALTCITAVPAQDNRPARVLVSTQDSSVTILDCQYSSERELTNLTVSQRVTKVTHAQLPIQNCFASSGGGWLVNGSEDNLVYIFSLVDFKHETLAAHNEPVITVACNFHSTLLASADTTGRILFWRRTIIGSEGNVVGSPKVAASVKNLLVEGENTAAAEPVAFDISSPSHKISTGQTAGALPMGQTIESMQECKIGNVDDKKQSDGTGSGASKTESKKST